MAIPIDCPECGETIGMESEESTLNRVMCGIDCDFLTMFLPPCPGKGLHKPTIRRTEMRFFHWVKFHHVYYPETSTASSWSEYVGPKNRFALWLVFTCHLEPKEGLVINHQWVWKGKDGALTGDGLKELGLA